MPPPATVDNRAMGYTATTTLKIEGMTCGACTAAVEGAFKGVAGIKSFNISLLSGRAVIEHDLRVLAPEKLAEMIQDLGFDTLLLDSVVAVPQKQAGKSRNKSKLRTTTVAVEGMTCGACTLAVDSGFKDVDGACRFDISLLANRAVLVHDPSKLTEDRIVEIIESRGFDAKVISSIDESTRQSSRANGAILFELYGLPDSIAAGKLEAILRKQPGVVNATVSFSTSRATIYQEQPSPGIRVIVEAIEAAGYNALVLDLDSNNAQQESLAKTKEILEWKHALKLSAYFAIPVFFTSMLFPMFLPFLDYGSFRVFPGLYLGDIVCLILTVPIQFGTGRRFYVSSYKSLSHGAPTMDVLVVLGTSTAFFFSVASMLVSVCIPPYSKPTTLFDTSAMLITFISLGRYLENSAKGQTSKALTNLMSLSPSIATIYADPIAAMKAAERYGTEGKRDGRTAMEGNAVEERTIPTELIEVGDIALLRPGDKIPADGIVVSGDSHVDESMVTGESMPIFKMKGAGLMAGTVNGTGRLDFAVTRTGRDTQLSQIVRLVQEAQTSRAAIQLLADTVAGYFVPIIIALGITTFVVWIALSYALPHPPQIFLDHISGGRVMVCIKLCIAVIVFACPCALGLATPTAVMVGTGIGAKQGILVKGGDVLETATKIDHIVFDKTGTLTFGKMGVSKADIQGEWAETGRKKDLWWTLMGLAETGSEHPIAKAIVTSAKDHLRVGSEDVLNGSVSDFEAVVGNGIAATVVIALPRKSIRYRVLMGSAAFLISEGINIPHSMEEPIDSSALRDECDVGVRSASITTIYTAIDKTYTGTLWLSDTIRPSARATVLALQRLGIASSILTGDTASPAMVVAYQVGIEPVNVHASATPADKKALVADLQSRGYVVAVVGDGINDSPALASADVGIALSSGTDAAMEAASIVLMSSTDLLAIPASLLLSKAIFGRIKMNLAWACIYNFIGLPFAMGFFLPWGLYLHPMAAGAAMACSSVSVVASSLHLNFWRRPKWLELSGLDPRAEVSACEEDPKKPEGPGVFEAVVDWIKEMIIQTRSREEAGYVALKDMDD